MPTISTRDSSPFGLETVAFASRTLTSAERSYAQIYKEAFSLMSGIKKFHHFLYGRNFTLVRSQTTPVTFHNKVTPDIISPRMIYWSVILNAYDFKLIHRPEKVIADADASSRLSCTPLNASVPNPTGVIFLDDLSSPLLAVSEVAQLTRRDRELFRVYSCVERGRWPQKS